MKVPDFTLIDSTLFDSVSRSALESPRKRSNYNFHELDEVYQRFLNVLTKGTYIQPHRHLNPPKPESFLSLKGELGFLLFDDIGTITNYFKISSTGPCHGIDIQPGVWHSLVTLSDVCVCFEGKSGPYDPTIDKEFAPFAPSESNPQSIELVKTWEKLFIL